jgi:hypothetical protein
MSVLWGNRKRRDFKKEVSQLKQLMHEVSRGNEKSSARLQYLVENDWRYKAAFEDLMRTEFKTDKA